VRFETDQQTLADAVTWTARVLPARPASPVMTGMRIRAGAGKLTLSAYDYEASAQAGVPARVTAEGSVVVPGRLLAEMVKTLPSQPVMMETGGTRATITSGRTAFTLMLLPEAEYPALPAAQPLAGTIGSDLLATAIRQTVVATSRDLTLPALTAVRMEISEDSLTLIGTDRYRLAVRTVPWKPAAPVSTAVLVGARTLADAARPLTAAAETAITLSPPRADGETGGIIGFESAGNIITTRLLAGDYPRYQDLLPTGFSAAAELASGPFADSVRRVSLVAERNTPVRLSLAAGQVTLSAGTGDNASATETVDAVLDGEDMQIAFNPGYLLDGISAVESDTVRIAVIAPHRPAVLTGKLAGGGGEPAYRYVLMPVRSAS
jgi:DNA polymerase-3 subunit beta